MCVGSVSAIDGEINGNIVRSKHNRKKMAVSVKQGKPALTNYKVLEVWNNSISFVQCKLHSGRTHQIRVHLNHINHPVLGDPDYGKIAKRFKLSSKSIGNTILTSESWTSVACSKIIFYSSKIKKKL